MSYLVLVIVHETHTNLLEGLFSTAASFLGTTSAVERTDRGSYRRSGKGSAAEELRLVEFTCEGAASVDTAKARSLEGVLRSLLATSDARGEVRVFVRAALR